MTKRILIFADGTGQIGGQRPDQRLTNIYKLYRAMRPGVDSPIDPRQQVAFYDPGIGTLAADDHVRITFWQRVKLILAMATGLGFSRNVADCYEAILRLYEPGDRIYLFGFSRGGYTARAVANVLNLCGVPTSDGARGPLPKAGKGLRAIAEEAVYKVYNHGAGADRQKFHLQREQLAREFRAKYAAGEHPDRGDVHPEGIAVFDAVAALGFRKSVRRALMFGAALLVLALLAGASWALGTVEVGSLQIFLWMSSATVLASYAVARHHLVHYAPKEMPDPQRSHWALWSCEHYDLDLDPRIELVRHAIAIDEDRKSFQRVGWGRLGADYGACERTGSYRFIQMWFAGNHSDIGGSYPEEESRLSDITLSWVIEELKAHDKGLLFQDKRLHTFPDPLGVQHSALADWIDAVPAIIARLLERFGKGQRKVPSIDFVHSSVQDRMHADRVLHRDEMRPYRPQSLLEYKEEIATKWGVFY